MLLQLPLRLPILYAGAHAIVVVAERILCHRHIWLGSGKQRGERGIWQHIVERVDAHIWCEAFCTGSGVNSHHAIVPILIRFSRKVRLHGGGVYGRDSSDATPLPRVSMYSEAVEARSLVSFTHTQWVAYYLFR